jgi:hypothetical protein
MEQDLQNYDKNVFINCPFDDDYQELFNAALFAVLRCGFKLRCAKERSDSNEVRIEKIFSLIETSKYSIHDLSRVQVDLQNNLPRFNMPLELGIVMGCQKFGNQRQRQKKYLILDKENFKYQKTTSDIAGQDIKYHNDNPEKMLKAIRDWLSDKTDTDIPSASIIMNEFKQFQENLAEMCKKTDKIESELTYNEYLNSCIRWHQLYIIN